MSYTLIKTGAQIDDILVRAQTGGEIDQDLALKAPLASPALTGTPTAPTPAEGDSSTKIATTEFVAAATAGAITDTAGPADVVTIPDGSDADMLSFKAGIEPVQSLNGYANPWPAGGGKNKVEGFTEPYQGGGSVTDGVFTSAAFTGSYANVCWVKFAPSVSLANGQTYYVSFDLKLDSGTAGFNNIALMRPNSSTSVTGTVTAITTPTPSGSWQRYSLRYVMNADETAGVLYIQAKNATSGVFSLRNIMVSSDADTSYAPYSNLCPITGWTGASGRVTGVNLVNWNVNTTASPLSIALKPDTYTISAQSTLANGNWYLRFTKTDGSFISDGATVGLNGWAYASSGWLYGAASGQTVTFAVPSGVALVEIGKLNADGTIPAQLELGSTATTYEAYNGTTYPIDWTDEAGTVYGGTIDLVSGVLTVTHARKDLGTLNWNYISATTRFNSDIIAEMAIVPSNVVADIAAEIYTPTTFDSLYNGTAANNTIAQTNGISNKFFCVKDTRFTDGAALKAALSGVYATYILDTPQTYQLDPVAVRSLLGVNNCWADTGETEIEYKADLKLYIDKKIAEAL